MRTIQQIVAEITRDAPSTRVLSGERAYVRVEVPGSGGAHATLYLAGSDEDSLVMTYDGPEDKGRMVTFKRGSARESEVIVALANFLVLHESIRDRIQAMEEE